ncbi:MAG: hypothetical protein IJF84_03210 [Thermoguttaceae bacterium]|nr:hypothetical protein [Thermoguttaceae bacterium]
MPNNDNKPPAQNLAMAFVDSLKTLKYVFISGGGWYSYNIKTGWKLIPEWSVKAEVNRFCLNTIRDSENLSKQRLNDVMEFVKTFLTVPERTDDSPDPAQWLRFENGCLLAESAAGWIACNNALLDVEKVASALYEGKPIPEEAIKPLSPELFVLGRVPCDFDPVARCPRWFKFVNEVCLSAVDRYNLQRLFGLSLTYNRKYNVFFVLYGVAGTGKSTALAVLEKLNFGTVCAVSLSDFGKSFAIFPLTENRLNLVADMPAVWESASTAFDREAVLKSLTESEIYSVERKFQDTVKRRLVALSVFGSNQVPRFADRSGAIRQRLRLIPFPVQFRGTAGQNPNLKRELLSELSGVLTWALSGYGELITEGYKTFPESSNAEELKHEAELQSNPVLAFCEECLKPSDLDSALSSDSVYKAYQTYCIRNGLKPMASNRVIPEICSVMGIEKPVPSGSNRRKTFFGICFANDTDETSDEYSYSNYE